MSTLIKGYMPFKNEDKILVSTFRADSGFPPKTMLAYPIMDGIIRELTVPKNNDLYMLINVEIHEKDIVNRMNSY